MNKPLKQFIIGITVGLVAYLIFKSVLEVILSLLALFLAYSFFKGVLDNKDENG